jgi:hypothetical protein
LSATVDETSDAADAAAVFEHVTIYLFYALGWPSWAGWQQMSESDTEPAPDLPRPRNLSERYLQRLARESRDEWRTLESTARTALSEHGVWSYETRSIRSARDGSAELLEEVGPLGGPPDPEWLAEAEDVFEVTVHSGSLVLSCATPTINRAGEFAGTFARLATDMALVFEWARK